MKKKFLTAVILLCMAVSCILCLSACGGTAQTPPTREKAPAPIGLTLKQDEDYIGVTNVNYTNGYLETECKLDDGQWRTLSVNWDEHGNHLTFTNLEPGSTHTVYARAKANESFDASDPLSKSVTLEKASQTKVPEGLSVKMTTGRTVEIVGLTDDMEVRYNASDEWVNTGTHTYDKTGVIDIAVRYKESASHFAGQPAYLRVYATDFGGGMGSEQDPFRIENYEQLAAISDTGFLHYIGNIVYFRLENDIDFTDKTHTPIEAFRVCLDGNGKKFTGVNIESMNQSVFDYVGVFRRITEVRDLTIENATVSVIIDSITDVRAGIICGDVGTIENCTVNGIINVSIKEGEQFGDKNYPSEIHIGGLTPFANTINNCSADVKVVLPDAAKRNYNYCASIGGLAGNASKVSNSSAKLAVNGGGNNAAVSNGAVIGGLTYSVDNDAEVENCFAEVNANFSFEAPNNPTATLHEGFFGGLIGDACSPIVKNCYALSNFSVKADSLRLVAFGGLTAGAVKSATNCFADGTFTAEDQSEESGRSYIRQDAFAVKTVYPDDNNADQPSEITNCYYTSDSGLTSATAAAAATRAEMRTVGWQKAHLNFDGNVWIFNDGTDNKYYPTLK